MAFCLGVIVAMISRRMTSAKLFVVLCISSLLIAGCGSDDQVAGKPKGDAANSPPAPPPGPAANAAQPDQLKPWIVLSDFSMEKGGLTNKAQVTYRFVQGRPDPGREYYLFVEQENLASVSWVDEPVKLNPAGGKLTIDVDGTMGAGQIYTFIAAGQRSTSYGDPEPEHLSGKLYLGQSESSSTPHQPDQEPAKPELGKVAVLTNPRREPSGEGEMIAVDYQFQTEKLPEAAGFWLEFIGAEGGSVSYDVAEQIQSAPASGTFRVEVPDPEVLESPYEVTLKVQPYGARTGASGDTVAISEVIRCD